MTGRLVRSGLLVWSVLLLGPGGGSARSSIGPEGPPTVPSPRPSPEQAPPRSAEAPAERGPTQSEPAWTVGTEILERLAREAELYKEYALRFTCIESVRLAKYDSSGEASDESARRYAYLLERDPDGATFREFRQKVRQDDTPKGGEVTDEEPFPPSYAWVAMFSRFYQPYFAYRDLGDRFEGFDWVREIQFRGALPFTDGKDIREWEGTVLVDAATFTPLEIRANPTGQDARVAAIYSRWSRSFNLLGIHLAPRPFLYRCMVQFRLRKDGLTFPTELRYDTLRAVSPKQTVPWRASTRRYDDYRFFKTKTTESEARPVAR